MEIDEAISIITYQTYHPDKVEESCQILLEEIERTAKPILVEKAKFMDTLDYGIAYNCEKRIIRVDPIVFAFNLRDVHRETGISYGELVWYFVEHEKGHFELQRLRLEPPLPNDRTYMTLYNRFEDYAISVFLRKGKYIEVEREVLKAESKRGVHTFNDLCVIALCVALGYMELKKLQLPSEVLNCISLISSSMKEVEKQQDIPEVVHRLNSKLAREDWNEFFLK